MSEPSSQLVSQLGPVWPWLTAVERKRRPPSNISPRFAGGSKKKRDIFEDYYMLSWENGEITYVRVQNKDYGLAKIIWTSVVFFLSIYHAVYVAQRVFRPLHYMVTKWGIASTRWRLLSHAARFSPLVDSLASNKTTSFYPQDHRIRYSKIFPLYSLIVWQGTWKKYVKAFKKKDVQNLTMKLVIHFLKNPQVISLLHRGMW